MARLFLYPPDVKVEERSAAEEAESSGDTTETSLTSVRSEVEDEGEKESREEKMEDDEAETENGEEEHSDEETKAKKLMEVWKSEVRMWRFDLEHNTSIDTEI